MARGRPKHMMNRYTTHAIDHNRGLIAPVRAVHTGFSLIRTRRRCAVALVFLFLLLLANDLWISQNLRAFGSQLGGDFHREISLIQQFGGPTSILLVVYFIARFDHTRRMRLWDLLLAMGYTLLASTIFKVLIGRVRPRFDPPETYAFLGPFFSHPTSKSDGPLYAWQLFSSGTSQLHSMPSSHTSAAFAMATCLAIVYPRVRGLVFSLACVVGFSRVMYGSHWPSDVLAGAVLGYWVARIVMGMRLGQIVAGWLGFGADRTSPAG